ncbi:uncharacterized protein PG986_006349 [Apiospora aurea]|uniref:Uncharacterized protein n=1 Tax=Apiospora aurea TaxID=335848 RepID=A0ABR1QK59_9PEZI
MENGNKYGVLANNVAVGAPVYGPRRIAATGRTAPGARRVAGKGVEAIVVAPARGSRAAPVAGRATRRRRRRMRLRVAEIRRKTFRVGGAPRAGREGHHWLALVVGYGSDTPTAARERTGTPAGVSGVMLDDIMLGVAVGVESDGG